MSMKKFTEKMKNTALILQPKHSHMPNMPKTGDKNMHNTFTLVG